MSPTNKKNHIKAKNATSTPSPAPNAASPVNAPAPAIANCIAFRTFIELADLESIKHFLTTAASTPEGRNLEYLWDRAFEEGQRALLQRLDKKLNDADDRGYSRGFEEGQSSKFNVFATGLEEGRADHSEWIAAGHGDHCFSPIAVLAESSVQTNPKPVSTSTCTQTDIDPSFDSLY